MDAPNRIPTGDEPCHSIADAGKGTVTDRRRMLEDHRVTVAAAIAELTNALAALDRKIAHYEAAAQGEDLSCAEEPLRHVAALQ